MRMLETRGEETVTAGKGTSEGSLPETDTEGNDSRNGEDGESGADGLETASGKIQDGDQLKLF